MNNVAKELWDKSIQWLGEADTATDINSTIALTGQAEIALRQAEFAAKYPDIVGVVDPVIAAAQANITPRQVPSGPPGGPQVWR